MARIEITTTSAKAAVTMIRQILPAAFECIGNNMYRTADKRYGYADNHGDYIVDKILRHGREYILDDSAGRTAEETAALNTLRFGNVFAAATA